MKTIVKIILIKSIEKSLWLISLVKVLDSYFDKSKQYKIRFGNVQKKKFRFF